MSDPAVETNIPPPAFAQPPLPQFAPRIGVAGQTVTLFGQHFDFSPLSVRFAEIGGTVTSEPTATQVMVSVPAGVAEARGAATTVKITVTTPGGSAVSADPFTIFLEIGQNPPAPSFATPAFAPMSGIGGQPITLFGKNFDFGPVSVKFDGAPAAVFGVPTATQIVAVVPMEIVPAGGQSRPIKVTVTTEGGSVTSDSLFLLMPSAP